MTQLINQPPLPPSVAAATAMHSTLAALVVLLASTANALSLTSRRAALRAGAAGAAAAASAAAVAPAQAKVTPEQRAQIFGLYGEVVPEDMSDKEFRQRYAAGSAFSQDRQDTASALEKKMGITSSQSSERATKASASEQRDIERMRENSMKRAPKPKPVPRNRL